MLFTCALFYFALCSAIAAAVDHPNINARPGYDDPQQLNKYQARNLQPGNMRSVQVLVPVRT